MDTALTVAARIFTSLKKLPGKSWRFFKAFMNDSDLWVRGSALSSGVVVAGEAVGGAYLLATAAPAALAVVGIPACAALLGVGIFGIYNGAIGTGQRLRNLIADKFFDGRGRREEKPFTGLFAKLRERPFFQKPFMKKLFKSRFGKTQRQKDMVMSALTVKGSVFSIIGSAIAIGAAVTTGTAVAVGVTVSSLIILSESIQLFHAGRLMVRSLRKKEPPPVNDISAAEMPPAPALHEPASSLAHTPRLAPEFAQKNAPSRVVRNSPPPPFLPLEPRFPRP